MALRLCLISSEARQWDQPGMPFQAGSSSKTRPASAESTTADQARHDRFDKRMPHDEGGFRADREGGAEALRELKCARQGLPLPAPGETRLWSRAGVPAR
jgi:hypothetical protein